MLPQPKSVNSEVRLENQVKTSAPVSLTLMYARAPPRPRVQTRPAQGRPVLSARVKIYAAGVSLRRTHQPCGIWCDKP